MKTKNRILTKAERDVLISTALCPQGKFLSNKEIGQRLGISTNNVKTLIHDACIKLGARNRNEAIVLALRKGDIRLTEFWSLNELEKLFSTLESNILGRILNIMRQVMEYGQHLGNDKQFDLMGSEGSDSAQMKIEEMKTKITVLTKEERDVLILSATHEDGRHPSNSEIGQRLGISTNNVKIIIHDACRKLGAHNRIEAALLALKEREIRLNDIYSLEQIAEFLRSLDPNMLIRMADIVRQGMEYKHFSKNSEQLAIMIRRYGNKLTKVERDVVIFAGLGYTNREIADRLFISPSSAATYLRRSSSKLGAHKRADAFMMALKQGEISIGDLSLFNDLLEYLAPLGAENIESIAKLVNQRHRQESTLRSDVNNGCPKPFHTSNSPA